MDKHVLLQNYITRNPDKIGKVVDYTPASDRLMPFDFTAANTELSPDDVNDTGQFSRWVNQKLTENHATYGIGGYMEHRTVYARSELFNTDDEPRRLHLGTDIWATAGTPVYVPISGHIHSFQDNDHFGDYGPTVILKHQLYHLELYSLYGHLSRQNLSGLKVGMAVEKGQKLATFGADEENGHWPPHLHFQLMFDIGDHYGDYPGVARYSERNEWRKNIPDPNLILGFYL